LLARIGWVLLMAVLAACVFLSLSRGGVCALLAGIAVTAAYWLRSDRRIATVAAVVGVAAFVALALWPDRALQARFQTLREKDTPDTARLLIWRQSVKLWQRYPLWGCGYNAYHTVPHPDSRLPLGKTATHSESDYFQNLSEGGLVGVGFALAFVILAGTVAYRTIRPKRTVRRTEHEDEIREDSDETVNAERQARTHRPSHGRQPVLPDNLASGALGALTALAVHALVDVPLRVPLDAFVAAAVAGLIMPPRDSRTRFPNWPDEALHERLVMAGVALLACIAFLGQPGQEALYSDTVRAESSDHPAELLSALKASPDYWYLWALINQRLQETARQANSPEEADALKQTALFALGRACEVNPQSPALLGELAARRWEAGRFDDAREAYWRLFETVPEEPTIWIDWMRVEWISGNRHAARAIPRRADEIMDLPRNRVTLWKELAALEATRGSIQRMLDALRNGAAAVPDDPDIRWSIAVCERELGYRDEEQQTVTRITQLDPKDWRAWWRLAQIQAQNKDGAAVNRALNKAVNLNPSLRSQAADLWTDMTSD
jgi:tetratricopeptide (TPR) repeat protein